MPATLPAGARHLDRGGPAVRARGEATRAPACRFIEEDLPDLVGATWCPQFIDYLALSFNTSTAFSPTDVSAIRHWSKAWLMMKSAIPWPWWSWSSPAPSTSSEAVGHFVAVKCSGCAGGRVDAAIVAHVRGVLR